MGKGSHTPQQRDAAQAAMKAKMQAQRAAKNPQARRAAANNALRTQLVELGADPADVKTVEAEVLPPIATRDRFGRYLPGVCANPNGRSAEPVAPHARRLISKYKLWDKLAEMAAAQGKHKDIEPGAQLRAISAIFDRAYGTPIQMSLESSGAEAVYTIKRIIGVDAAAV